MTERPISQVFQDILETIMYLETFTNGVSFEAFEANPEKLFAVVKAIEIIGEAVKKIPDETRSQYSQIPWKDIAGMRDILVHNYWRIDSRVVWSTVQDGIPLLKTAVARCHRTKTDSCPCGPA
jgi:uncharacterized protein with HEPN domain